tara:strand:+ start:446 stop:706 length:261 start_codon:yes stop_codon:yes gene_type:complete
MMIYEFDLETNFEFECDLVLDRDLRADFDDTRVVTVVELLKMHGVTNFVLKIGMNPELKRTVTIQVHEKIPESFNYDLSTNLIQWR